MPHPELNKTEARQAKPVGAVRIVLAVSLALVVVVFAAIFLLVRAG